MLRRRNSKAYLEKVDADLRRKAAGRKYCSQHPRKKATLIVLWADGRAFMLVCNGKCLKDWEKKQGRWACVVRVIPVLGVE